MDSRSLRIANRLVGNPSGTAAVEATLVGPKLRFGAAVTIAVTGAPLPVTLDGVAMPQWSPFVVPAGSELALGTIRGVGMRAYVAVHGGLVGKLELESRSVFAPAGLGGQPLRRGDTLEIARLDPSGGADGVACGVAGAPVADAAEFRGAFPELSNDVALRVVLGPHGAPEFLTSRGLAELLDATWTVDPHSNRTGVRLVGPRPGWARADGGEAGLHPSNILDSAYSVGTIMLAGDMAVIVGPDGPSLGGFTAIAQVIRADLWRLGQLRVGDRITLQTVEPREAATLHAEAEALVEGPGRPGVAAGRRAAEAAARRSAARSGARSAGDGRPRDGAHGMIAFRRAGESAVLVEFGEPLLDLRSRVRAHALHLALAAEHPDGVTDVTPGVRSLHVQHDPDRIAAETLIDLLGRLEASAPAPEQVLIEGRTVRLPLAWRHSEAMRAVERYQASVRDDAPWCPDNIDFIRRVNGLADEDAVRAIVTDAAYLVLGLGDVYLGAPVAVPLDPRHVLVTTKYNPARTWTPANAVGIGGAFLCVYGMEGPGGYQLVGRTVPVWHTGDDPPWRLRHFDQLRFELVGELELEELRARSHAGTWRPRSEPVRFSLSEHERFLAANAQPIADFTQRRDAAFAAERSAWIAADEAAGVAA
jgi:urea carboxylase